MNSKPKTLQEAIQYFSNEQVCIDTVAAMRWPDGKPTCPACGHQEHYYLATQKRWKCKECWKQFSVKVGTIFEDSPLGLDKWLCAIWMIANCKNGVSSYEIHRALGITQKSAWFMLHRIRVAMQDGSVTKFGRNGGECEADESYVGGKAKNMHKSRKLKLTRERSEVPDYKARKNSRYIGKVAVMGIVDREARKVRALTIESANSKTLQGQIHSTVERGATIYTDAHTGYTGLEGQYSHATVDHLAEYVVGRVHTNTIENFWSCLKRGLNGTYISVEPMHLDAYVDEQVFRYNNRGNKKEKITDSDRFALLVNQISNKRLTWAELTNKICDDKAAN